MLGILATQTKIVTSIIYLPKPGNLLAFQAFIVIPHIAGDDKPC